MDIQKVSSLAAALSDPTRLRLLAAVLSPGSDRQDVCVCELTELVDLAPSTVSKHLSILRDAGLIEGRKQGRWMYYRVAGEAEGFAADCIRAVMAARAGDRTLAQDGVRLRGIIDCSKAGACCPADGQAREQRD